VLAGRLVAAATPRAISNQAIAGNRVLSQGAAIFGASALARFDRDVLAVPNAKWLIVLEGINDIGMGAASPPSAEQIIGGPGAFVVLADGREQFAEAVRRKLILEISGLTPETTPARVVAD